MKPDMGGRRVSKTDILSMGLQESCKVDAWIFGANSSKLITQETIDLNVIL